jgi:hypothetical protein
MIDICIKSTGERKFGDRNSDVIVDGTPPSVHTFIAWSAYFECASMLTSRVQRSRGHKRPRQEKAAPYPSPVVILSREVNIYNQAEEARSSTNRTRQMRQDAPSPPPLPPVDLPRGHSKQFGNREILTTRMWSTDGGCEIAGDGGTGGKYELLCPDPLEKGGLQTTSEGYVGPRLRKRLLT